MKNSKKILIYLENNQKGGMDSFLITLCRGLKKEGQTVHLLVNSSHPGVEELKRTMADEVTVQLYHFPLSWSLGRRYLNWMPSILKRAIQLFLRFVLMPLQFMRLLKILIQIECDGLLVVNGAYPGGESCRLATIAFGHLFGKDTNKFNIHSFHSFCAPTRKIFYFLDKYLDYKTERSVTSIVSVSLACAESLRRRTAFNETSKLSFIYNGIAPFSKTDCVKHRRLRDILDIANSPIVVCIANYEIHKGHKFLFSAFESVLEEVKNAKLVTFGAGTKNEFKGIYNLKSKSSAAEAIHIMNFDRNVRCFLEEINVLVIPSRSSEAFGLTAAEAMQQCIPVVSTDVGGLPEVIGPSGTCGYLVDKNDKIEFSRRIVDILLEKVDVKAMGISGRQRARDIFSDDKMVKSYLDLMRVF